MAVIRRVPARAERLATAPRRWRRTPPRAAVQWTGATGKRLVKGWPDAGTVALPPAEHEPRSVLLAGVLPDRAMGRQPSDHAGLPRVRSPVHFLCERHEGRL